MLFRSSFAGDVNKLVQYNDVLSGDHLDQLHEFMGVAALDFDVIGTTGNDILYGSPYEDSINGGDGDDVLYAGSGVDIIFGGDGMDNLYGQSGADTFVFEAISAYNDVDQINDFDKSEGDALDLSDLLQAYDPVQDAITDFVSIVTSGDDTLVRVDANGGADNFVQIAKVNNVTGLTDEDQLVSDGTLIVV